MNSSILAAIDLEIERLLEARALLAGTPSAPKTAKSERKARGIATTKPKRTLSEKGRKAIAAAQKKRWAALKAAAKI